MVTRNVPLDVELIPAVVKQPAAYIGLMGSARRWSTTKKLLIDAGCSEDEISGFRLDRSGNRRRDP